MYPRCIERNVIKYMTNDNLRVALSYFAKVIITSSMYVGCRSMIYIMRSNHNKLIFRKINSSMLYQSSC